MSDKNVFETAYDKTKDMACKAGQMTKDAASDVKDYVTGDDRTKTEKNWDATKDNVSKGVGDASDYVAEKTHDAADHIKA